MKIFKLNLTVASSVALLIALPASQTLADSPAEAGWRQVAYICESGQALTVDFRASGSAARVTAADQSAVKLNARPAKSGFRYGDSRHELRGEGDVVTWQIGSKTPLKCTSDNPTATKVAANEAAPTNR